MKRILAGATLVLALLSAPGAWAQTYKDRLGTTVQGVAPIPRPYNPLGPGQYGTSASSAVSLTPPVGATYAVVCAVSASINYTTDGQTTPTASVGMPLPQNICVSLYGPRVIANFLAIGSGAKISAEFFN